MELRTVWILSNLDGGVDNCDFLATLPFLLQLSRPLFKLIARLRLNLLLHLFIDDWNEVFIEVSSAHRACQPQLDDSLGAFKADCVFAG